MKDEIIFYHPPVEEKRTPVEPVRGNSESNPLASKVLDIVEGKDHESD